MKTLNIGKDFSPDPAGRYRSDGEGNGESFREDFLKPALNSLQNGEILQIIIDDGGIEAYGSSFLVEGFAGIVKYGYFTSDDFLKKIEIKYNNEEFEFYKNKIIQYIKEAKFNSSVYNPSQY